MKMETIDTDTLRALVAAGSVRNVSLVGQPGGWVAVIHYGMTERVLAAARGNVRVFRTFETMLAWFRKIGIVQFTVDASNYDPDALKDERRRADASERMRRIMNTAKE